MVSRYWWSYVMFCDPRNFHWAFSKMNILGHPESQWVSLSLHDCDSWDLRGTMRNVWNGWKLKHPIDLLGMGYIQKGSKRFVFLEVLGLSDTTCSMCFWCKMQAKRRPSFCWSSLAKPEFLQWFFDVDDFDVHLHSKGNLQRVRFVYLLRYWGNPNFFLLQNPRTWQWSNHHHSSCLAFRYIFKHFQMLVFLLSYVVICQC